MRFDGGPEEGRAGGGGGWGRLDHKKKETKVFKERSKSGTKADVIKPLDMSHVSTLLLQYSRGCLR